MAVFYVFKLGPVPTDDGPTTFYVGMGDGWIFVAVAEYPFRGGVERVTSAVRIGRA